MSDLYDGTVDDEAYRMEIAEEIGTGFDLSELYRMYRKRKRGDWSRRL